MTTAPDFIGGPTGPARSAPGPGGYVLAVVVADLAASLMIGAFVFTDAVTSPFTGVMIALTYVSVFSIPFALAGSFAVHLAARRIRRQSGHVLAAGAAGLLSAVVANATMFGGRAYALFVVLPVATALGRAALVPAVQRAQRAQGRRQEALPSKQGTGSGISASPAHGTR